jgi:hypothetical protein
VIPPLEGLPIQRPHGGLAFQHAVGDRDGLAQFVGRQLLVRRSPVDVVVIYPLEQDVQHDAGETTRATHSGNEVTVSRGRLRL